MNFDVLLQYAPSLLSGFVVTVACWASGGALGLLLGLAVALALRSERAPVRWPLRAYIETLRGTPFLLQLFVLYAGGPAIGLRLSATAAGVVGLGLYSSAYFAEIFRAGFAAVPAGLTEAAASVGMAPFAIVRRISLPVALVSSLPPIVNMLIVLSKETVVLSIITVPELMYQAQTMAAETFTAFEAIFALAVFYWLLVESASRAGRWAERRATVSLTREARAA
jgi:polar amino acid transport system permease protein